MFLRDTLMYQSDSVIEENPMFNNNSFKELSKILPKKVIYQWLDILNECNNEMRFSTKKRAYLELAILKMNDTKLNEEAGAPYELKACVGYAKYDYDTPVTIPQLISEADEKLYEMKNRR